MTTADRSRPATPGLRLRRLGIDTHQEPVVYMRADCEVCRSEGFDAQSRVEVRTGGRSVVATLNVVHDGILAPGEAGLSEAAWRRLAARDGDLARFSHPRPVESLRWVRSKVYGQHLCEEALREVVRDVVAGSYADVHLAAFVTACGGDRLDLDEMTGLTRAMVAAGNRLTWPGSPVVDKHSVGGLPGNRTTPIIVPIVAAFGLTMPKTSSRAITSPAGTADTMETLAPVALSLEEMRRVVEREGACIAWGGGVHLSPADDVLIRVERALDLDSEGQLVASVLSKKVAAGSTHVALDVPVGPTAKVRSKEAAAKLVHALETVGHRVGLEIRAIVTDGSQPVGRGIGPALEARDVVAVLRGDPEAPRDLRERALLFAGLVLEMSGRVAAGEGLRMAEGILDSGRAWTKFQAICAAQGGMREPSQAVCTHVVEARRGRIVAVDNRGLARVAKLAGAPAAKAAGVLLHARPGDVLAAGQPLFSIHAETPGELAYALDYVRGHDSVFQVVDDG